MSIHARPPELPDEVLARRMQLPLKPDAVALTGQFVRLAPLVAARDAQSLFTGSNGDPITLGERRVGTYDPDAMVWRYMSEGPFAALDDFTASLEGQVDLINACCLCVFDAASGQQIGVANFLNNVPGDLKMELGGIWYSPVMQRTEANTEAT